jgi:hypothetical protein
MKAEHRKELHTNYLADQMGRLVKGMRAGPQSTSSTVAWVLVSLTIGTVVVWYVTAMNSNRSPLWVKFETDASERNLAGLEKLTRDNPSTLPARASRFEIARVDLQSGMANLYSSQRDSAVSQVKNAKRLYGDLVKECTGDPILAPQALMGAAKAEEALVGIPKDDNPAESEGNLDKALGYYEDLVKNYPKSFLTKTAQERIDNLGKTADDPARQAAEKFYQEMRKLVAEAPKK